MKRVPGPLLLLLVQFLTAGGFAQEQPRSNFLEGLLDFVNVYAQLERAIEGLQADDEKHLVAVELQRLANGFYKLKTGKHKLTQEATSETFNYDQVAKEIRELRATVDCMGKQVSAIGLRLRAQDIDGQAAEQALLAGLDEKAVTLKDLAYSLRLQSTFDAEPDLDLMKSDSRRAENIADELATKATRLGMKLDPSVSPTGQDACTIE